LVENPALDGDEIILDFKRVKARSLRSGRYAKELRFPPPCKPPVYSAGLKLLCFSKSTMKDKRKQSAWRMAHGVNAGFRRQVSGASSQKGQ
jgi:hypothetical protein